MASNEDWGKAEDWGSGGAQDDWTVATVPEEKAGENPTDSGNNDNSKDGSETVQNTEQTTAPAKKEKEPYVSHNYANCFPIMKLNRSIQTVLKPEAN